MIEPPLAETRRSRILIVGGNQAIHELVRGYLYGDQAQAILDIDSAREGLQALALVRTSLSEASPYGLALVDERISSAMSGPEMVERLWEADARLEIGFMCGSVRICGDLFERIGTTEQLLVIDKPLDGPKLRQAVRLLRAKWRLGRTNERQLAELNTRIATRTSELEDTSEQLRQALAERTRMEQDLRRAQRLEALGRLAAGLGHEINNPLSFMISGAEGAVSELERLERELPDVSFTELRELVDTALVGADRIAQIVRNIKLVAHRAEHTAEAVDLAAAIQMALKLIKKDIGDHIQLRVEMEDTPNVWCKRIELEQVFVNLLQNAAHAMSNPDWQPAELHIKSRLDGEDSVIVEISDTGQGIEKDVLDKVFDPFFTTKPPGVGTGLGLSICHAIVAGLGGSITLDSQFGRGTIVTMRMPCLILHAEPPTRHWAEAPVHTATQSVASSKGRILVVDDEPLIRKVIKHALHMHDVVVATNGREALARCMSQAFDVILCDIMMPEINGLEFYERLQEMRPGMQEDIIFFTGGTQIEEVLAFIDKVPNECLEKPVQRRRLQQRVDAAVRRKRQ